MLLMSRITQGRVLPVIDSILKFDVSGVGKLIGVGNGDPTDHEADKGSVRKAFCGYCMGIVQTAKESGSITVEASSPGLTSASVTIAAKQTKLRPQVATWKREVPVGPGLTGLWRPMVGSCDATGMLAMFAGDGAMVFALQQEGSNLTGTMEGGGGGFFGGSDAAVLITNGKVDGKSVSFKVGNNTYSGTLEAEQIELQPTMELGFNLAQPPTPTGSRPAVGPPPDGSDRSLNSNMHFPTSTPVILHRVVQ